MTTGDPARPAAGRVLCRLADIPDPGAKGFEFKAGDHRFAAFLVRRGVQVWGYIDRCPHAGWPLSAAPDRYLTREGDRIVCAGHGALFRPEDGLCMGGPCAGQKLERWAVRVFAGVVRTA